MNGNLRYQLKKKLSLLKKLNFNTQLFYFKRLFYKNKTNIIIKFGSCTTIHKLKNNFLISILHNLLVTKTMVVLYI